MIYVNLIGGLGNQMFQYAMARELQSERGDDITISLYECKKYYRNREPNLQKMTLNDHVLFKDDKLPWQVNNKNLCSKIRKMLNPEKFLKTQAKAGMLVWYGDSFLQLPKIITKNVYIGGYFQSERYFKSVVPFLKKEFTPRIVPSDFQERAVQIRSQNSVCIHIRRGDYVGTDFEICDANYYQKALNMLVSRFPNLVIYVYSDDISWAKSIFSESPLPMIFMERNDDYLDLFLMSCSKYFVLSNSSFSWWAQELSDRNAKEIIAPAKWHKKMPFIGIHNNDWILL